jgi:hypothetical protein
LWCTVHSARTSIQRALVENSDPVLIALFLVIMPEISVLLLVWAKRKGWW